MNIKSRLFYVCITSFIITLLTSPLLVNKINATTYEKPIVVLAFHDAYNSTYNLAYPYLKSLGLKGTLYPITSLTTDGEEDKLTWETIEVLDWVEIQTLLTNHWSVVSHSDTHIHLIDASLTEIENELNFSRTYIDGNTTKYPYFFIYPFYQKNSTVEYYTKRFYKASISGLGGTYPTLIFKYKDTWTDLAYNIPSDDWRNGTESSTGATGNTLTGEWGNGTNTQEFLDTNVQRLQWLIGNGSDYAMIIGTHHIWEDKTDCRESPYSDMSLETWKLMINVIYDCHNNGTIEVKTMDGLYSSKLLGWQMTTTVSGLAELMIALFVMMAIFGIVGKIGHSNMGKRRKR